MAPSLNMKMKLLVNTNAGGRVLYAEEMDSAHIPSADARNALLSLPGGYGSGTRLLQPQSPAPAGKGGHGSCYNYVTVARNTPCCLCRGEMNVPIEVVSFSDAPAELGFVKEVVTYTIMDDLKVAPMSAVSVITLLNALGVTDISSLQEITVRLGYNEGLEMLRASLQSKTVLTDVFLRRKNRRQQAAAAPSNKKRKLKAATLSKALLIRDIFLRKKKMNRHAAAAPSSDKRKLKATTSSKKKKSTTAPSKKKKEGNWLQA